MGSRQCHAGATKVALGTTAVALTRCKTRTCRFPSCTARRGPWTTDNLEDDFDESSYPIGAGRRAVPDTIGGLGTFDFVTPTRFFFNDNIDLVGFSRSGGVDGDLFNGPSVPGGGWDMATSIGPVVGIGTLLQWTNSPVNTTGGVLVFNNGNSTSSFTATVGAPEPATLLLLGVGAVCGGLRRRSRRG